MESHLAQIKKSVTFIFVSDEAGSLRAQGTGFFVGVRDEGNPGASHVYLVTAKHVLQNQNGDYLPEIVIRLNVRQGDSQLIKLPMKDINIFEHPDKDVDIAVFACLPDEKVFDFKFIPDDLITHSEWLATHKITEGDAVFFAGLFVSHIGQKRNQPLVRFGKVALISEEKIEWKDVGHPPKWVDLYLLECQSFAGNSGAPVFLQRSENQVFLAGLMKGGFLQGNEIQQSPENKFILWQNAGISAVTPAEKLYEILFSEKLIQQRGQAIS
jgi:hypothetical protein